MREQNYQQQIEFELTDFYRTFFEQTRELEERIRILNQPNEVIEVKKEFKFFN